MTLGVTEDRIAPRSGCDQASIASFRDLGVRGVARMILAPALRRSIIRASLIELKIDNCSCRFG
jgi:hypothetical protein